MPPLEPPSARLAELVGRLSLATDLAAGLALEAARRTCLLATELGRDLGLKGEKLSDVYYTGLLRFLGCTAYAHEAAQLMAGDDHAALRALSLVDPSSPISLLSFAARDLGKGAPSMERARTVARFLSDPQGFSRFASAHCDLAMHLARQLGMTTIVVQALGQMFERYEGKGAPGRVKGEEIHLAARILHVATRVEMHRGLLGADAAIVAVKKRSGRELDPEIAGAFLKRAPEHLARLAATSVWDEFLAAEPEPRRRLPRTRMGEIAEAFARYVDMKSPYTLTHSTGVARLVAAAAQRLRRTPGDTENMRVAALLHDLGRTAVPNGIWEKPGPLNTIEFERMQQHAYHSDRILVPLPLFADAARLAGLHHERLDGSGYFRRASGATIPFGARLLAAADAFHAMQEERPHRPALTLDQATEELMVGARAGQFDRAAVEAVLSVAGGAPARVRGAWPANLSEREVEVIRLLAKGLSNKQIGTTLFISARTVQQHIRQIYEKTQISTRASAALFAVENNLFD